MSAATITVVITTIGGIAVAIIVGTFQFKTAMATATHGASSASKEAKASAKEAREIAATLAARQAQIETLHERVEYLEARRAEDEDVIAGLRQEHERCEKRIKSLEAKLARQ